MRGTHNVPVAVPPSARFIPAHAGNTRCGRGRCARRSVHPRACGEHRFVAERLAVRPGSSPRMRGTPPDHTRRPVAVRFIPAHAGNTGKCVARGQQSTVHPRACGEHIQEDVDSPRLCGSSPRMRGTPGFHRHTLPRNRFIPAHAGNTLSGSLCLDQEAVHPRACGEHSSSSSSDICPAGSSPRMRGTRKRPLPNWQADRFIPAHAGNTSASDSARRYPAVHPRACGEHLPPCVVSRSHFGSSPRMRGTLQLLQAQSQVLRFIPAHAGNTARGCPRSRTHPVHPRACGEHAAVLPFRSASAGSSPRMRGTRISENEEKIAERFIPAHAGNTTSPNSMTPLFCGSSPRMRGTPAALAAGRP